MYGPGWMCTLVRVGADLQQGNIIVVSKAVSIVVLMQDELLHLKHHLPRCPGVTLRPTQVDNVVLLLRVINEAVCGAEHPARTDEAATTQVGDRASMVLPVDGGKPWLVLDGGEFSTNNLKARPQSLLATLKLSFFWSEGIFSRRAFWHHALPDKLL